MKCLHNIDMQQTQFSKLLSDIVIIMGCNVKCPYIDCSYKEDWELDDPTRKDDQKFKKSYIL